MPRPERMARAERLATKYTQSEGCWEWTGPVNHAGYGRDDKKMAHRSVYEALVGPIPVGLDLDHLCRNRVCVRPDHLEPVTHAENMRRASEARTHCNRGHEYTPENTRIKPAHHRGRRSCKECHRITSALSRARKRAA